MHADFHDIDYWVRWAAVRVRRSSDCSEADAVADFLGISARTVRRWQAGATAPKWAFRVLMMLADGIPVGAGEAWQAWRFTSLPDRGTVLQAPDGSHWSPADLLAYPDVRRRLREAEARMNAPAQLAWVPADAPRRRTWPGGAAPTWDQLEEALRRVMADAAWRERI